MGEKPPAGLASTRGSASLRGGGHGQGWGPGYALSPPCSPQAVCTLGRARRELPLRDCQREGDERHLVLGPRALRPLPAPSALLVPAARVQPDQVTPGRPAHTGPALPRPASAGGQSELWDHSRMLWWWLEIGPCVFPGGPGIGSPSSWTSLTPRPPTLEGSVP